MFFVIIVNIASNSQCLRRYQKYLQDRLLNRLHQISTLGKIRNQCLSSLSPLCRSAEEREGEAVISAVARQTLARRQLEAKPAKLLLRALRLSTNKQAFNWLNAEKKMVADISPT